MPEEISGTALACQDRSPPLVGGNGFAKMQSVALAAADVTPPFTALRSRSIAMQSKIPPNAMNVLSRTLAATLLIIGFGFLGYWGDLRFDTKFLTPLGFIIGMFLGISGLILIMRLRKD